MNATTQITIAHTTTLAAMADELGTIKAAMADLKAREDALKAQLAASGYAVVEGDLYRAAVSHVDARPMIDWQAVAKHLNPSRQLVVAHTTYSTPYTTVRLCARKTA